MTSTRLKLIRAVLQSVMHFSPTKGGKILNYYLQVPEADVKHVLKALPYMNLKGLALAT